MLTLLLAWVNSAYKTKYELTFIATFIMDLRIIDYLMAYLQMGC